MSLYHGCNDEPVKPNITSVHGRLVMALAVVASTLANAQTPPQPTSTPVVAPPAANIPSAPPTLPGIDANTPLGHVVQMLQSGDAETVILAYISSATVPFNITAADLVSLNDLGTPSEIETAMTRRDQELGVNSSTRPQAQSSPPGQNQEPEDITGDYFYGALAPYGSWVNIPGYGLCWQPCAATYNPGWTPYSTLGQWLYTDCGWYWLSGYSWGWSVFHYGRWFHDAQRGWCWWPATKWAPSWVFWRYTETDCGWAPLPPHCYYSQGNGLVYNGAVVPSGYDFGIGENLFTFVPMAKLCDGNTERYRLSASQSAQIFAQSHVLSAINSNDRTIVNDGIPVHQIAAATHGVIRSVTIQPVESVAVPGARGDQVLPDGETLAVNRPYFTADVPSALRQGIYPVPAQEQPVPHQPPTFIVNENPLIRPNVNYQNNSVIYVDRASQYAAPVPTVTIAGPFDSDANGPPCIPPAQSYWAVMPETAIPIENDSEFMSPRLRSHERWEHHTRESPDHRESDPTSSRPHPEQQQSHQDHPPEHPAEAPHVTSTYSSPPNAPEHAHSR